MHKKFIVHRDLKLDNIMIGEDANGNIEVKIIDFGSALKMKKKDQKLTSLTGSLFYAAPEVLEGSYGIQSDMWSLGIVAFSLITGRFHTMVKLQKRYITIFKLMSYNSLKKKRKEPPPDQETL